MSRLLQLVIGMMIFQSSMPTFSVVPFRLSSELQDVNWDKVVRKTAYFLDEDRREILLSESGHHSINPLLFVTELIIDPKLTKRINSMGLQRFAHYIARKANSLLEFIEKYENKSNEIFNWSTRNSSPQNGVNDYYSLTIKPGRHNDTRDVFLEMYRVLFNENIASYIRPLYQSRAYKQSEFRMTWPWPEGESWFVGGTHTMTGDKYGVFSALDVYAPGGVCSWEGDNSCVENFTPQVTAMHSGKVNKISRCSLKIIHESGWATSYYHLDLLDYPNIQTGIIVKQGDIIGRYAGRYDVALCTGGTSTGPIFILI